MWCDGWLPVTRGPDLGFPTTISGDEADRRRVGGFLYDRARHGEEWVPIRDVELRSHFDDRWYPSAVHTTIPTDDHSYEVEGEVWANIPLRNRRNGLMTRITEGMTRWRHGDIVGAGLSEYLDHTVEA